jgi:hypothetical protein
MADLIAFLDVLGMGDRSKKGDFHPFELLDLVNPVGLVASRNPEISLRRFLIRWWFPRMRRSRRDLLRC